ncbi:hypothetical protein N657DRAFT_649183 [Parathielavia appendiculata]|uniref:Uncharacterized protein n=1 Tax=Parathielavia appendiculata TaxID=2587402 RepID=A0AAN6TTE0_9PEZI|nr:hypothetical protein N657DRAFT_649183 [Parathielavia appendiculata]
MAHKHFEIGLEDVDVLEDDPRPWYAVADGPPILDCLGHRSLFTVQAVSPVFPPASTIDSYLLERFGAVILYPSGQGRLRRTYWIPQNVLATP